MGVLAMLRRCVPALGLSVAALPAAALALEAPGEGSLTVVVLDRSGSMGEDYGWLAELVARVDAELAGAPQAARRYGLVEFSGTPKVVLLEEGATGGAGALGARLRGVQERGSAGQEDGYRALHFALAQFAPLRTGTFSLLLVSNEDRDALEPALHGDGLAAELARAGAVLDVLVNVRLRCADGREALGTTASASGYVAAAGVEHCDGAQPEDTLPAGQSTAEDYVQLALRTGGTAWNIYRAWGPEHIVGPFANAFAAAMREGGRAAPGPQPVDDAR